MPDNRTYASYAVICELNNRELRRMISLFPDEQRYLVVMASGIIGVENARRIEETPAGVAEDGAKFVAELREIAEPGRAEAFREVLEHCLIEAMKDELGYRCPNCRNFTQCLDLDQTSIGELFRRRAEGGETEELKKETALRVSEALQRTPYLESDCAHLLCRNFRHQYPASGIGDIFRRYADIAAGLQHSFGADYRKIQQEMVRINMAFVEKSGQKAAGESGDYDRTARQ